MSSRAPIGYLAIAANELCTNQGCKSFVPSGEVDSRFLFWRLKRDMPAIAALGTGNTFAEVSGSKLKAYKTAFPSLAEQRRIADRLDAAMAEVSAACSAIERQHDSMSQILSSAAAEAFERLISNYPLKPLAAFSQGRDSFRDGPFGSNLKTAHYSESGARVIRLQNIGTGRFLDDDKAFIPLAHYETIKAHSAAAGDVLVAALGDDRTRAPGRACLVPDLDGPAVVKADCFRVRLAGSKINAAYIAHYLNSPRTRAKMLESTRGATRPRINLATLRAVEIPAAPIQAQQDIVDHLDDVANAIQSANDALRVQFAALEALPGALLGAAFRGDL